ncbi:oxidoreductase [Nakamurella flavida]|uniref:Oxidoreductase n=1 Tax=Nakamurella flavida TaxID=363630 RepID=A0A938YMB2_9ACTN|nr:oxidoreductase [Nakamurella flavida]MBM9475673.1 oxidoreductase [Nakamurella flavida]MDP9778050.1 aryl-alcohol dehydrogenase-like predicted oxidoreductase [Nakamurella flavida]
MSTTASAAGTYTLGGDLPVARMGYGAMRLSGPHIMGPPADRAEALAVLRRAVELGVNHIDTSDFYGPHTTNEVIREALHPYADDLVLVTKVGARRTPDGGWPSALGADELTAAVHDNLRNLGLDRLDVVNLRMPGTPETPDDRSLAEPFEALAALQQQGLIRHLGISHATAGQLREARAIAPVVCVQNAYNVTQRADDALLDECTREGIAFVPYFPLGGFAPLQADLFAEVAQRKGATTMQLALAWLLARSPAVLAIPGTSSVAHLEENLDASAILLDDEDLADLDALGR